MVTKVEYELRASKQIKDMFYGVEEDDFNFVSITSSNSTSLPLIYKLKLCLVEKNRPFEIEVSQIIISAQLSN